MGPKERILDEEFLSSQMELYLTLFKKSWGEDEDENVLVSPLSIQLALAMTANGANGGTKSEMEGVLADNIPLEDLNEYLSSYVGNLPSSEKSKLSIANSIWFRDADYFSVKDEFLYKNASYYRAQIYKAQFDQTTVNSINDWIDKSTDSMIQKVLEQISNDTVMYLINAIAFDAKWEDPISERSVYKDTFVNINSEGKEVDMMYNDGEYLYIETENATGFKKNYEGGDYSFVALLPREGVSINDYIASLDGEEIIDTLSDIQPSGDGEIRMPKFSYEYGIEMREMLCELGMPSAFSESADFSNMTNSDVFISGVIHKTFISVDNEGTRAAAVTVVECKEECEYVPDWSVTLDRPFVYMIVDNETNLPIFIGCLTDIQ
jgi:serpin B